MFTLEEAKTIRIPGLPPLTEEKLKFIVLILNGLSAPEAYREVFGIKPNSRQDAKTVDTSNNWTKATWYKKYFDYFSRLLADRQIVEQGWNLDMSILERRKLFALNYLEVERLAKAYDKAIEYWIRKKEEAIEKGNEKDIDKYEERIIKEMKAKNMAIASNQACLQSLEGLDKLMGLQTMNVNHTGSINFVGGDDMWDDNVIEIEAEEQ